MKKMTETVLYYTPDHNEKVVKLKGVLVRMGIRIKNVAPEQVTDPIGSLLGLAGFEKSVRPAAETESEPAPAAGTETKPAPTAGTIPAVTDEVLVMHNFSSGRLDELLLNLRKAGVPRIDLKAVVTETNVAWTFYQLYEEIKEEHEKMEEIGK